MAIAPSRGWGMALSAVIAFGGCGESPGVEVATREATHAPTRATPLPMAGDASGPLDVVVSDDGHMDADAAADTGDPVDAAPSDVSPEDTVDIADQIDDTSVVGVPCRVGARVGACVSLDACGDENVAVEGICDGGPLTRCCVRAEDRCSSDGAPGACLDAADCAVSDFEPATGLCPGGSEIQCCHPSGWQNDCTSSDFPVPTPNLVEDAGDAGCLPGMARVETFCVDRFEAAVARADDTGAVLSPFAHPASDVPLRAISARHAVPQGYIDGVSAARACAGAGKRLCTSTEWLRACQGTTGRLFPYGTTREPGRCNDARRRHPAIEYFQSSEAWVWSSLGHPCISQLPDSVHLTGEDDGCVTPEGVFDLVGNVHEWVDDPDGTFRGGFYADTAINGEGCLYRTTAHGLGHWDYSTGFRCCADAVE